MNLRGVPLILTVVNLAMLSLLLARAPKAAPVNDLPVLRCRGLEIVDDLGRVRASIAGSVEGQDPVLTAPRSRAACCSANAVPYGLSVTVACLLTPPAVPVTVNTVAVVTPLLETVTATLFTPAGTVTPAGRFSAPALSLGTATAARLTLVPPLGAAPFNVAVSRLLAPPLRLAGANDRLATEGAFTAREAA